MRSIGVVFRAEFFRRWASWLALSLLVTLIGGTVLAGVSTAQRTSAAFSNFTERYGYDAEVFASSTLPKTYFKLPYVTRVTSDLYYGNGNATPSPVRRRRDAVGWRNRWVTSTWDRWWTPAAPSRAL